MNDAAPLTITGFVEAGQHDPHLQEGSLGQLIDLNGRLNGNLKIRRSSFF
ncbi:MAG: hypothetical protein PHQ58_00095 [Rhodoferax sp.]|nr:hypothetical protein [Rhodoferax sp.]MDD2878811.1 hypothetical protein [Rhodoferax sp.]